MSDNEESGDNGECFVDRPKLVRSPEKTEMRKMTRSSRNLSVEEERGILSAENDVLREQNVELLRRIEKLERTKPDYSGRYARRDDGLTKVLSELCKRMDDMETRSKGIRIEGVRDERADARRKATDLSEDTARPKIALCDGATTNAKLPKGGWLKNPFDELKFTGRNDPQNPIKFLRRFEKIAKYEEVGERDQLYYFGKCLRGAASNWYVVRDPEDIFEAKEAFIEYFWGEEQQNRFREDIYNGKYSYDANITMSEYALNLAKQTKFLVPPMSDSETIRCIKRHFGAGVAREIRPSTVKSIESFITLLDEIDYEQKRERKARYRSNNESASKNDYAKKNYATGSRYPNKETNTRAKGESGANKFATSYNKEGQDNATREKTENIPNNRTVENISKYKSDEKNNQTGSYNKDTNKKVDKNAYSGSGKRDASNLRKVAA